VFKARLITAAVLAPLALFVLFGLSDRYFYYFVDLTLLLAAWEWANLSGFKTPLPRLGYTAVTAVLLGLMHSFWDGSSAFWVLGVVAAFWALVLYWVARYPQLGGWTTAPVRALIGFVVILPVWPALQLLKISGQSDALILMLLLLVWGADVGAYFAGKSLGKNKLAPAVSPGKTREGLYGGLATCLLVGAGFSIWFELDAVAQVYLIALALVTGLISVLGDLFESMLKRHRGIKDSSQLLPGHGGVLDRIDSLTAAAPLFVVGIQFIPFS